MRTSRIAGLVMAVGVLSAACVDLEPTAVKLQSFRVTLSSNPNQEPGTPDAPLPYLSGKLCGKTACQDSAMCGTGEMCLGYCETTGTSCTEDSDCPQRQACVERCTGLMFVDIEAMGNDGGHFDYEGPIRLDVSPGFLPPSEALQEMKNGHLEKVPVYIASASGKTNVWAIQDGYRRRTDDTDHWYFGQCNDGVDNDDNGQIDLADPGCQDERDDVEAPVEGAMGVSPDIWFALPSMRSIQGTPALIHSPLDGQDVTVREGDLVVTSVTNSGLYITDMRYNVDTLENGEPGYYNSIFLYTWSTPEGVRQGDFLCRFSGGVIEFQGNTQLTFPSFEPFYADVGEDCRWLREAHALPADANRDDLLRTLDLLIETTDPETGEKVKRLDLDKIVVNVSSRLVPAYEQVQDDDGMFVWKPNAEFRDAIDENACALEPFESGLVEIENVEVSTLFVECDQDRNGVIDEGDESGCRTFCNDDPLCSELGSFERYRQWSALVDGKMKMYVNQEMLLEHVPLDIGNIGLPDLKGRCRFETFWYGDHEFRRYVCPPLRFESVRGNLRQVYLCGKDHKEAGCPLQLLQITPTGDRDVVPADEPAAN